MESFDWAILDIRELILRLKRRFFFPRGQEFNDVAWFAHRLGDEFCPSRRIKTRSPGNSNSAGIRTAWLRLLRNSLASLGLESGNDIGIGVASNIYAKLYMPHSRESSSLPRVRGR
ncbi:MAG: hypothetical protein LBE21_00390, partial [Pseudomonadales bacterium]|nr:hypothetical protein [Pseudomonadales bacterium]